MKNWHLLLVLTGFILLQPPTQNPIAFASAPQDWGNAEERFWQKLFEWEGGYSNHPADKGGETNLGITASLARRYGISSVRSLTKEQAIAIYRQEYDHCFDNYQIPALIAACLDTSINWGAARNPSPGTNSWFSLSRGLNPNKPREFIATLYSRRREHRRQFIARNPEQKAFEAGWARRDKESEEFVQSLLK